MAIIKIRNAAIDLDAAEIPNISASKITSGTMDAARIGSGTFADARIAASNVSQHASSFDDNKIVNDISTLGLRVHTQENLNASNSNSASFDVFQDSSGILSHTTSSRNADEYVSPVVTNEQSLTINNSNYSTYITEVKGRSINTSTYAPYAWSNWSLADNSTHVGTNSGYGTKGAYTFGSNGDSDQSYWKVTNNGSHSPSNYRFHAIGYKLNTSVLGGAGLALRNWGLKWRNGDDGYWWTIVYPSNSDSGFSGATDIWSAGGCRLVTADGGASNGNSYSHASNGGNGFASNSVKASTLWVYQFHYDNLTNFMFDELFFTGQASVLTVNATGNFISNAITTPSSTNKMGAIITYQDNAGTNALNTDIVLELSADNGSNFTTATLTALPDFATGIKMAKVNDLSVTAGTQLKYKISFANQASGSKEARIRGVSLQY